MTALYVIGSVLRFLLRIILLPVQAVLTLLLLAVGFVSGMAQFVFGVAGAICFIGGMVELISSTGSTSLGLQGVIGGIIIAIIPQAIAIWGQLGIISLKHLLARV